MEYNELYHHGIKGQRWGVRRFRNADGTLTPAGRRRIKQQESDVKTKRHIGIDEKGNINLITGKTTDKAKRRFAIKSAVWIGSMAAAAYIKKHPEILMKGKNSVDSTLKKMSDINLDDLSADSGIYSKSLGRMLTLKEVIDAGIDN